MTSEQWSVSMRKAGNGGTARDERRRATEGAQAIDRLASANGVAPAIRRAGELAPTSPTDESAHGSEVGLTIAVVHAADGVRQVVAARSADDLMDALADYVRRRATKQLWPRVARRVHELLVRGRAASAVELYFAQAGHRWDEERLTLSSVEPR